MLLIIFWVLAGILIGLAFSFIIPALLGTTNSKSQSISTQTHQQRKATNVAIYQERLAELEQQQTELAPEAFQQAKQELDKTLLQDVTEADTNTPQPVVTNEVASTVKPPIMWVVFLIILVLPIAAVSGYLLSGSPQLLLGNTHSTPSSEPPPATSANGNPALPDNFDQMITKLADRLKQEPNDLEGWTMLGRSFMVVSRFDEAVQAFEKANELANSEDPNLLASLAEAMALTKDGALAGEPLQLIELALSLDAQHQQALWLAGMAAFQANQPQQAIDYWQQFLAQLEDTSENSNARQMVSGYLQQAQQQLARPASPMDDNTENSANAAIALAINVSLAPELLSRTQPTDTVFVFARALQGAPMPLAVARHTVAELPISVILDDSMAMLPSNQLSQFKQVQVVARVSRSGLASAQDGDLEGLSAVIELPHQAPIELVIDQVAAN